MSASARSSRTSFRNRRVPLVRTTTGIRVIFLISRMRRPRSLLRVGSPEPEKVTASILCPDPRALRT